ncbi:hypothetical protein BN85412100 [Alteracholeplasma palmae J233]|uniref:Chorismate mutase domain-containing protein n=1 Tax=Alteracholeplasma palmae (strain ATCC 49389 / J233) TaxID=1318466 RepID=U4KLM8_ALTPJ|nr:chorismate mutase [Alteracholeplasma palmae]CCV64787.1 hypothetical protein BN85412100 [Alteracholeplasma palmae J233]
MKTIEELRLEIDKIDQEMKELFIKRMEVSKEVGIYKKENNLPILDQKREDQLIEKKKLNFNNEELWSYYEKFIKYIMELSKEIQK